MLPWPDKTKRLDTNRPPLPKPHTRRFPPQALFPLSEVTTMVWSLDIPTWRTRIGKNLSCHVEYEECSFGWMTIWSGWDLLFPSEKPRVAFLNGGNEYRLQDRRHESTYKLAPHINSSASWSLGSGFVPSIVEL